MTNVEGGVFGDFIDSLKGLDITDHKITIGEAPFNVTVNTRAQVASVQIDFPSRSSELEPDEVLDVLQEASFRVYPSTELSPVVQIWQHMQDKNPIRLDLSNAWQMDKARRLIEDQPEMVWFFGRPKGIPVAPKSLNIPDSPAFMYGFTDITGLRKETLKLSHSLAHYSFSPTAAEFLLSRNADYVGDSELQEDSGEFSRQIVALCEDFPADEGLY